MPATRPTTIQQRQEILRLAERGMTVAAIAQALQLAPRTVRKWRQRAAAGREGALVSCMGRPTSGPLGTRSQLMRYVALRLKRKHLTWGATYIIKKMSEHPGLQGQALPDRTSVWRYLRPFSDRLRPARPRPEPRPSDGSVLHGVWQLDFKESVAVAGVGTTTITHARDLVGRVTVCHRVHVAQRPEQRILKLTTQQVQADCRVAFTQWGLPDTIRTDRASIFRDDDPSPFPTRLVLWWVGLGIEPQRIRRGVPEDNSAVERAHRTADERTLNGQTFSNPAHLQQQLDADWHELNWECPSRARDCHGQPPLVAHPELLQPRREYRPEWEARLFDLARVEAYLASHGSWLRTVSGRGQVTLANHWYVLGMAWRHQTVSIQYDLRQHDFLFTLVTPKNAPLPKNPEPRHCPAHGLSPAGLIGSIDLALAQPARQLSLLLPMPGHPLDSSAARLFATSPLARL
jgi:Homeodomain-like domain/Integrase core domain